MNLERVREECLGKAGAIALCRPELGWQQKPGLLQNPSLAIQEKIGAIAF